MSMTILPSSCRPYGRRRLCPGDMMSLGDSHAAAAGAVPEGTSRPRRASPVVDRRQRQQSARMRHTAGAPRLAGSIRG